MRTVTIPVEGMTCQGCVNSVTKALRLVDGVETVEVSLELNEAKVIFNEATATEADLKSAIEEAGYDVA
ncbi:heavy-metal-associated domain-containing protein [Alicyclobacillus sp. SO9]|uniref:heavy-metal-associated domain-containing protein n=1 Tax=Alicyclobacillus sp. SO9 TaxID=2665646 RepID=UPI0018E80B55|nr:copper ion binding protein [Alicyclobacillus sp. SO9]QQE78465.1 heavy-metal-associated domain-containing protein [Alicyclobacillus sp. SO9]